MPHVRAHNALRPICAGASAELFFWARRVISRDERPAFDFFAIPSESAYVEPIASGLPPADALLPRIAAAAEPREARARRRDFGGAPAARLGVSASPRAARRRSRFASCQMGADLYR